MAFGTKPDAYSPYAAGNKIYGGGRLQPTIGPVSAEGYKGYAERDRKAAIKRNAWLQQLKALQSGDLMSSDYLGGPNGSIR